MASYIGRRKFLATLGGAAAAWPLAARAQQPAMPVVGFLRDSTAAEVGFLVDGLRKGLAEAGFVEVTISPSTMPGARARACGYRRSRRNW